MGADSERALQLARRWPALPGGRSDNVDRDEVRRLKAELAVLDRPPLAKTRPASRRAQSEERAARAFARAVEASGMSQRAVARHLGLCERIVRDYLAGARQVPVWALAALPRAAQVSGLRALAEELPETSDEDDLDQTGSG